MTSSAALPYRPGVGGLLFNPLGEVFVGRRIGRIDAWQLPQGGIKKGEEPEAALVREMLEEVGTDRFEIMARAPHCFQYDLPEELVGRVWKGRYRGQRQYWFALRFTGCDADFDLAASGSPEFDQWAWLAFQSLPDIAVSFKQDLYRDLVQAFSGLATSFRWGGL